MVEHAAITEAGTTVTTGEFIAMANIMAALTAFYGSIDQLKHRNVLSSMPPRPHA
jgi:hypothetical protein